eukprot:TRINITY_DN35449_c0_g1_i1.p1 TRINITY_DN35449_c0_g1~~TRINITY_DN35449_c0_g1_i1.p1  ORF type:complete len:388 (+),score=115.00 TRINITY_DN35449_c0_g1_i1:52-1164(+)
MPPSSSLPPPVLRLPLAFLMTAGLVLFVLNHSRRAGVGKEDSADSLQSAVLRDALAAARSESNAQMAALRKEFGDLKSELRRLREPKQSAGVVHISGGHRLVPHEDFEADYDLNFLKERPPEYQYPSSGPPPFLYPPDVPTFPSDMPYAVVSHQPTVYYFPEFITPELADAVVAEANTRLSRSQVGVDVNETEQGQVSDERTSDGCWLTERDTAAHQLREKVRAVTGFDTEHMELTQVLRYRHRQKYNQHVDFIDPEWHSEQLEINSQRAATLLVWLVDLPRGAGGETVLPMANGGPQAPGYGLTCGRGLRMKPRKGAAMLVYDMKPDKAMDPYSLHGACPVTRGTKYIAVQWLRVDGKWDKAHGLKAVY